MQRGLFQKQQLGAEVGARKCGECEVDEGLRTLPLLSLALHTAGVVSVI